MSEAGKRQPIDENRLYAAMKTLEGAGVDLEDLDPICAALSVYQAKHPSPTYPGRVLPNRLVAVAAIEAMETIERQAWERD